MQVLHPTLRNLVTNERGHVAMTFGLTAVIACAFVGGAVDFGRAYQQKSKMQNALDAAVVSAVTKYKDTNNWAAAKEYGQSVFAGVYQNAVAKSSDATTAAQQIASSANLDRPIVNFQMNGTIISGSATMTANTPFINMAINQNLRVTADSNGTPPSGRMLEVALMVDLTGSMGWSAAAGATSTPCSTVSSPDTKIEFLKCAGEDLLNILLPTSGVNNDSVKIGIAPFSDKVNAGEYAAAATGLSATGGSYANISNLASTKQGAFTGTYSGVSTTGSQFGAMGYLTTAGSTTTTAGGTFNNSYCATPTTTTTITVATYNGYRTGERIDREDGVNSAVEGLIYVASNAANADRFKHIDDVDGTGTNWIDYDDDLRTGYFAPRPLTTAGLAIKQRTSGGTTANVGARISVEDDYNEANILSLGFMKASGSNGYWRLKKVKENGTLEYDWTTSGFYLPIYDSLSTTTTVTGCESPVVATPSSKLITCVTERVSGTTLNYTAAAPSSGNYVGAYNHGITSVSNYSSDGKCYTAGRELPSVIPLTNDRTTLASFFQNASVGGATAGHLGTAWASYLLSPAWSTVWPTTPASYTSTTTDKVAILMTDGEYNIQYSTGGSSSATSAKQALMLCKEMRDNGIKVYTVGFGFGEGATPPNSNIDGMTATERTTPLTTGTANQKALDTLAKCASANGMFYFPYDGQALRTTFKNIANAVTNSSTQGKARLTN